MKAITLLLLGLGLLANNAFAEGVTIDSNLQSIISSGIACETFLDGNFNESIRTVYFNAHEKNYQTFFNVPIIEPLKQEGASAMQCRYSL